MTNPLAKDLDYIVEAVSLYWQELQQQRIFITGGTGFFGCWLLESFIWANDQLGLNAKATVLTRNKSLFAKKHPHLAQHRAISFYEGDVTNFTFPEEHYSHIIHAATEVTASSLYQTHFVQMLDTIIQGTAHTLAFAQHCRAKRFLLVSSGAVYGKQPTDISHIPEDYNGKPDIADANSTYGLGKCVAEHLCQLYHQQFHLHTSIARCFAVIGPYLPLAAHFAAGNFLKDLLDMKNIIVQGDGTPLRSYLYMADLTVWLWRILFSGQAARAYNVGSEQIISIAELANLVASFASPQPEVIISQVPKPNVLPTRYIPDTTRAQQELGLTEKISLTAAIEATLDFFRQYNPLS